MGYIKYIKWKKYIYPYLNICQERLEMNSGINEKSNCIKRSINGCFCTKIYKDWCTTMGTTPTPILRIDQISLWKCIIAFRPVVKVIKCLVVKKGFKSSRTDSPKFWSGWSSQTLGRIGQSLGGIVWRRFAVAVVKENSKRSWRRNRLWNTMARCICIMAS